MQPIVVGIDGSPHGQAAAAWAANLAAGLEADLIVTTVWKRSDPEMAPDLATADRARTIEALDGSWTRTVRATGARFTTRVLDGENADALLELADRVHARLVVVGTRGTSGSSRLRIGSFSDWAAHRAVRPLAVIPSAARPEIKRIVLGLDGSSDQDWGVELTAELGLRLGAEVTAVHVISPPSLWRKRTEGWEQAAQESVVGWCQPLTEAGVAFTARVVDSSKPADELIEVAAEVDADVILIGTRALSGHRLLRLGGVTMQLLHRSDRPVVLVPPPS